ncbi:hypothetical protein FCV25MIE_01438 [Fagus crenata]
MDDALVDELLYQLSIGARVNGTFNSRAYDEIVKELVAKYAMTSSRKSKPTAKKWMATPIPNYFKMAQLWAKDRATGDHAETAKQKRALFSVVAARETTAGGRISSQSPKKPLGIVLRMETQKSPAEKQTSTDATTPPPITSCRKKKNEEAAFLEDVKNHIDEFIHASMDEHKSCFKKTIQKMFGMSKIIAEKSSETKEVVSSLSLQTTVSD